MEAMKGAFLGWVSQGLQHEVIVMASCCKKGGDQKGNNCHRQVYTQQCLWYCITVLRRDLAVVAGADLRLSLASCAPRLSSRDSAVLIKGVLSLAHQPAHSPQR